MKYNNFRQRQVFVPEFNKILKLLKKLNIKLIYVNANAGDSYEKAKLNIDKFNYSDYAIITENLANISVETKYYEPDHKPTRYICNLNDEIEPKIKGLQVFNEFQRWAYKAPKASEYNWQQLDEFLSKETGKYGCSASPIIKYNEKYEMQELYNIYEYDLNSAYSSILLTEIPDLNKPIFNAIVKKNQVGFLLNDELTLVDLPGFKADIVFDLIKLPASSQQYILRQYNNKHLAKTEYEKALYKLAMNAAIGYYQRFNPFLRSYIVNKCNAKIEDIIDDDTILCNTDAIFSLKRRPELELGTDIGQFKEIKIDRFIYRGNNYQVNFDTPVYRGIPKHWFKAGFNLLTDEVPKRNNKYKFNFKELKLWEEKD